MRRAHAITLALVPAAIAALHSCGGAVGHAPVGRLSLSPRFVCAGDSHLTVVRMNATLSADPVDDPQEKALPCTSDADCAGGRVCTDTGAPPDTATGARRTLCLHPLKYSWEIEDETFVKTAGDYAEVMIAGTFKGDRPYRVALTVTDRDGDQTTVTDFAGVTTVFAAACGADLDCPQGYLCADPSGTGKGCYADCAADENICNYCGEGVEACARCYFCRELGDQKLCLPGR